VAPVKLESFIPCVVSFGGLHCGKGNRLQLLAEISNERLDFARIAGIKTTINPKDTSLRGWQQYPEKNRSPETSAKTS
jgi:hypothetical protein